MKLARNEIKSKINSHISEIGTISWGETHFQVIQQQTARNQTVRATAFKDRFVAVLLP